MAQGSKRSRGTVMYLGPFKGLGLITPDDGRTELLMVQSSFRSDGGRTLEEGDAVEFTAVPFSGEAKMALDVTVVDDKGIVQGSSGGGRGDGGGGGARGGTRGGGDDGGGSCYDNEGKSSFAGERPSLKGPVVIEISSSSSDEDWDEEEEDEEDEGVDGDKSFCSSNGKVRMVEEEEDDEDCCILDFDPFQPPTIDFKHKLSLSSCRPLEFQDEDVSVVAERGEVACRDYPHSRHLCVTYPFNKTAHEICCPQCYCYVCDSVAPCKIWKGSSGHCHASDHDEKWEALRTIYKH